MHSSKEQNKSEVLSLFRGKEKFGELFSLFNASTSHYGNKGSFCLVPIIIKKNSRLWRRFLKRICCFNGIYCFCTKEREMKKMFRGRDIMQSLHLYAFFPFIFNEYAALCSWKTAIQKKSIITISHKSLWERRMHSWTIIYSDIFSVPCCVLHCMLYNFCIVRVWG